MPLFLGLFSQIWFQFRTKKSELNHSFLLFPSIPFLQSRIETPTAKKPNSFTSKILPQSPSLDDSNITLKSPYDEISRPFSNTGSLEQRVFEFEKSAKNMVAKLEKTKEKIEKCSDGAR